MKKVFLMVLAVLLLAAAFAGCAAQKEEDYPTPTPIADSDTLVCRVGNRTVTKEEYVKQFRSYRQIYEAYGNDFSDESLLANLRSLVMQEIVKAEAQLCQAEKLGYQLSDEELESAQQTADQQYENVLNGMREQAREENAKDIEARALELMEKNVARQGNTIETYKAGLLSAQQESMIIRKMQLDLTKDITISEDAIRQAYDESLAKKETYLSDKLAFAKDQDSYAQGKAVRPVYVPEGFTYVKHILVNDLTTANEVLDKLNAGEDFDGLVAAYSIDPGSKMEPYKSRGYLVCEGANYYPEFLEAALQLENVGDLSEPVKSTAGYHVLLLSEKLESKTYSYEEVRDEYYNYLLGQEKSTYYQNLVEQWASGSNVKTYEQRIADVY